jgi:hypothetical protein
MPTNAYKSLEGSVTEELEFPVALQSFGDG